jgi:hypothetical protein
MRDQQPPSHDATVDDPPALAYQPAQEDDEWLDEPDEPDELPARPRRRLLRPIPLALFGALLIAAGFIAGVQVQKGEGPSSGSSGGAGASLASRFAALRGGGSSSTGAGSGNAPAGAAAGGFPGRAPGARPTSGTVAYLSGNTLYVTSPEGNTIKINTSQATTVTKTVKTKVTAIHPGETVTVTGATGSSGALSAESISVGSSGGLAAPFGGSPRSSTGAGTGAGSGAAPLFGPG